MPKLILKKGNKYIFRHQSDVLVYLGRNWSGNGWWHQFAKVEEPTIVWSELSAPDLHLIENYDG